MKPSKKFSLFIALFGLLSVILFNKCKAVYSEKLYADVIGFNDKVITKYKPYDLTKTEDVTSMNQNIRDLPSGENTAAYYALDIGLDRIVKMQKSALMERDPNTKYYIVFLTDGLDNVSPELAKRDKKFLMFSKGKYDNATEYGNAMQIRMEDILKTYSWFNMIKKKNTTNTFQSYVLLYRGEDIEKSGYTEEELNNRLLPFAGAQNEAKQPVIQGNNLQKLLADFKKAFTVSSLSFIIPKGYAGQKIRMQLNKTDKEEQKIYIEADFKKGKKKKFGFLNVEHYTLENIVTSNGLSVKSINGVINMDVRYDKNSNTVPFTFNELRYNEAIYSVKKDEVSQWFYESGKLRWNSEYSSKSVNTKNAYIILIMDTSTSFKSQIEDAKNTAVEIIDFISKQL